MFRKLNTKKLLLIFGVLLALVVLLQIISHRSGDRNFSNKILDVDTAKLTAITLKHGDLKEIRITRQGNTWSVSDGEKTYLADKFSLDNILGTIPKIVPDHVSGTDKSDWGKLGVNDTSAGVCHVKLEQNGKLVSEFLVGRYSFEYPQTFFSYVRLKDGTDVYSVRDLMPMTFGMTLAELRNKALVTMKTSDIRQITFHYPADSSFLIVKQPNGWAINGVKVDSSKMITYLNQISNLRSGDFASDKLITGAQTFGVTIESNNAKPVEIKAFAVPDTSVRYIITTSQHPESRCNGKAELRNLVFTSAKHFMPAPAITKPQGKKK
jgi:hypothetical protein